MSVNLISFLIARKVAQNQGLTDPQAVNRDALPAALIGNPAIGVGVSAILAQQDAANQPAPTATATLTRQAGQGAGAMMAMRRAIGPPAPAAAPATGYVQVPNALLRQDGTRFTTEQANRILGDSQLVPAILRAYSAEPRDRVIRQDPEPGTIASLNSTVTLYVSDGPPPCGPLVLEDLDQSLERILHGQRRLAEHVERDLGRLRESFEGLRAGQDRIQETLDTMNGHPQSPPSDTPASPTEGNGSGHSGDGAVEAATLSA